LATQNNTTYPTNRPGYNLISKLADSIHIPFPPVCVTFRAALSNEEVEALKVLGAGVIPSKDAKETKYTFGPQVVNIGLLNTLYKHPKKVWLQNVTPMGAVNLETIQSMAKALGILTWFLKTHVYPAFVGPLEDLDDVTSAYDTIEGFITLKRKGLLSGGSRKKQRMDEDAEDQEMDDAEDGMIEEVMFGSADSHVPKAKPSQVPDIVYGPYDTMPTLPGLSFPYFEGIIASDPNFVTSVIGRYFLECLGDTREAILGGYKDLKKGLGVLANTATGRIMQHLFLGVKLAIETQTRMYPIFVGSRYVGFTLHGWYFTVSFDGYTHQPLSTPKLVEDVASIDEHNVAIAKICQVLAKLKVDDTGRTMGKAALKEKKDQLETPRDLAALIRLFRLEDSNRDEIEKLATNLSFPQRFWPIDNEHTILAVDLLLSGAFPQSDVPMYHRGGALTTTDHRLSVFAAFGDQAFSFRIPGGEPKKIPRDINSDGMFKPYVGKNQKTVTPRPNIVVARKSLAICLEDWGALLADHTVYTRQTRDAMFRSVIFGGDKAKNLWYELIKRIGVLETDTTKNIAADAIELGEEYTQDAEDSFADFL